MDGTVPRVAILTDSTASLPPELLSQSGDIAVVPLRVVLDGQQHVDDGVSITRSELADRMRAGAEAGTSQPSRGALAEQMRSLAAAGAEAIITLHLSAELSGTVAQSRLAAEEVSAETGIPIHVVDSRTTAGGLGLAVLAAAQAAVTGDVSRTLAVAREVAARSRVLFMVPDLQHLARGGRLSSTRASIGTALGVRPILAIESGRIVVAELARGAGRARRRIVELAVRAAGGPGAAAPRAPAGRVRVLVDHVDAEDAAQQLATALTARLTETGAVVEDLVLSEASAVIGAHTGPGSIGVALAPLR